MFEKARKTLNRQEIRQSWQQMTKTDKVNVNESERLLSLFGGLVFVLFGLLRRSAGSAAFLFGGVYLIYRGLTGHCHAYESMGLSTASRTERLQFKGGERPEEQQNGRPQTPDAVNSENLVDQAVAETFPASDPPAWTASRG